MQGMSAEYRTFLSDYSVSSKTLEGYHSVWRNKWIPFLSQRSEVLDPHLSGVPSDTVEVILSEFMIYLSVKLGTKSGTASSALAGVKHFLSLHDPGILKGVPEHSSLLRKTKSALANLDHSRVVSGVTQVRLEQAPMTYDMVEWLRGKYWDDPTSSLKDRMGYLAIMVGFNGLMRGSEFVYKKPGKVENSHGKVVGGVVPFTGGHVTFRSNTKRNGVEGLSSYTSEEVRVLKIGKESVTAITIVVPYTKTNKSGKAKSCSVTRASSEESGRLIDHMVDWCTMSGILDKDFFFSRYSPGGTLYKLRSCDVSAMMKEAALAHQINPATIGTRSLRIGGRTTMQNAGASEERVKKVGAWKSSAHHIYQRSTRMDEGALAVMSHKDVSVLHSRDLIS